MSYLLTILAGLALLTLWLIWNEPRMIYYPDRTLELTPDRVGLAYEDVWLTTTDNIRIHGWFLPAQRGSGPGAATPVILFFHGNAGNISHRFDKLEILHNLGAAVLILDYRGYGQSAGKPNEAGTYADARAAYDHLTKTLNREPRTVIVYGESLGSAVAVDLASKVPTGGVIIEEAFTSIPDVGQKMYPFLPVRWFVRNKYDTLAKIDRINAPLLMLHSRQDEFFPWRHAEHLYAAARDPKRLVELRGSHNDAFAVSGDAYRAALRDFLSSFPR
jgi:uncharacterized protein